MSVVRTRSTGVAARDALGDAVDELRQSLAEVPDAAAAAIDSAFDEIRAAIAGVSGSDTVGGAAESVQQSTDSLTAAVDEINDGVGCGPSAPEAS